MYHNGTLTLGILFVLNPIVLFFYQNCSVPPALAAHEKMKQSQKRIVSSLPSPLLYNNNPLYYEVSYVRNNMIIK